MWFLYVLASVFLLALVNYTDEYLTAHNTVPENSDIHTKIGGLVLISTLLCSVGVFIIWLSAPSVLLLGTPLVLAIASAIPMVGTWISYFYLLTLYPAYQVVPLFLLSSIWLLVLELLFGGSITLIGFFGVALLLIGAYFLDAGTVRWQVPTKLLLISIPTTSFWAIALFIVRIAATDTSAVIISFWQLLGIVGIGILLFLFVSRYRNGFLCRIRKQGRMFFGFSLLNESFAQGGYVFSNLAIAIAPVATYVTAMSGVQSLFLLLLITLFPVSEKRHGINSLQVISIILIVLGAFLIERFS